MTSSDSANRRTRLRRKILRHKFLRMTRRVDGKILRHKFLRLTRLLRCVPLALPMGELDCPQGKTERENQEPSQSPTVTAPPMGGALRSNSLIPVIAGGNHSLTSEDPLSPRSSAPSPKGKAWTLRRGKLLFRKLLRKVRFLRRKHRMAGRRKSGLIWLSFDCGQFFRASGSDYLSSDHKSSCPVIIFPP